MLCASGEGVSGAAEFSAVFRPVMQRDWDGNVPVTVDARILRSDALQLILDKQTTCPVGDALSRDDCLECNGVCSARAGTVFVTCALLTLLQCSEAAGTAAELTAPEFMVPELVTTGRTMPDPAPDPEPESPDWTASLRQMP